MAGLCLADALVSNLHGHCSVRCSVASNILARDLLASWARFELTSRILWPPCMHLSIYAVNHKKTFHSSLIGIASTDIKIRSLLDSAINCSNILVIFSTRHYCRDYSSHIAGGNSPPGNFKSPTEIWRREFSTWHALRVDILDSDCLRYVVNNFIFYCNGGHLRGEGGFSGRFFLLVMRTSL